MLTISIQKVGLCVFISWCVTKKGPENWLPNNPIDVSLSHAHWIDKYVLLR